MLSRGESAFRHLAVEAGLRRGVASALLKAAVAEAKARNAHRVHGYPVEPNGKTVAAAFAWTGVPALFEAAGFSRAEDPSTGKPFYALPIKKGTRTVDPA